MRRIALVLSALLLHSVSAHAAEPIEWNESWRWCKFANNCMVLKDECLNWTAVNSDYAPYANQYYEYARPLVECPKPFRLPPPKATCNIKVRKCEVTYD